MMKHYLSAARPRTLPLALSCILLGSFLAAAAGRFRWDVFGLAVLTTTLLQVLSNFANDYGDSVSGLDNAERTVARRAVQTGAISRQQMRTAMLITALASLVSGIFLLKTALVGASASTFWGFVGLGLLAIVAAVTYTVGKRPYGYAGLGDVSVFLFFGLVGVLGTYYLHTRSFEALLLLPATACGVFAVGVLNINNIRDLEQDRKNGKNSVPVRLGASRAKTYQWGLIGGGLAAAAVYVLLLPEKNLWQGLFLLTLPLFVGIGRGVQAGQSPAEIDPFLKRMALTTLLFVLLFGLGQVL